MKRRTRSLECGVAALLLLASLRAVCAESMRLGDFEAQVAPVLRLSYKSATLIDHDAWTISGLEGGRIEKDPGGRGFSYSQEEGGNRFRREIYLTQDGLEITASMHVENLFGRQPDNLYSYDLCMPPSLFEGRKPFAVYGRQDKYSGREFDLSKPIGPGESYSGRFRHLALEVGSETINLDMSPMGPPLGYTTNHDLSYGARPARSGEFVALKFYRFVSHFGGDLTLKIVIRAGKDDYYSHHHLQVGHYTVPFEPERSINFTTGAEVQGFVSCGASAFDAQKGFGWKSGEARMVIFPTGGPLKCDAASGLRPAEFQVSLRPGYYLLNYVLYNPNRGIGPFSVTIDGRTALEKVFANKGQLRYLSASFYAEKPETVIGFDGDWQVNALEFTPVFHRTEDYSIKRPFWNMGD